MRLFDNKLNLDKFPNLKTISDWLQWQVLFYNFILCVKDAKITLVLIL